MRWYATGAVSSAVDEGGEQEHGDVEPVLLGVEGREHRRERHREQEPEQHLHAETRDPQLLEQLGQVAVDALGLGLVPTPSRREAVVGSSLVGHATLCTPTAVTGSVRRSTEPSRSDTMSELPPTLQVQDLGGGRWAAPHPADDPEGRDVIFSGQILAQMIMASDANCGSEKEVKSIHAIFARAGTYSAGPMELALDAMHAGRAWASDTITAYQGERLLSRSLVLLNTVEPDLMRHSPTMPDVPGPDAATPNPSITVFPGAEARLVDAPDAVGRRRIAGDVLLDARRRSRTTRSPPTRPSSPGPSPGSSSASPCGRTRTSTSPTRTRRSPPA